MQKTISKQVNAIQWPGPEAGYPEGLHETLPEVHWAAGRELIYFTYGRLQPKFWMGVEQVSDAPESTSLDGWVKFEPKDREPYYRKVLPFAFWDVKSEAQMKGRSGHSAAYKPVFLNVEDTDEVCLFHDYCQIERWPNPLPRYAEFREVNGSYGRGYLPHYLAPGDWLLDDAQGASPYRVLTDEAFRKL